jgi:hypothetical protein
MVPGRHFQIVLLEHREVGVSHLIGDVSPVRARREEQGRERMPTMVELAVLHPRPFENRRPGFRTELLGITR